MFGGKETRVRSRGLHHCLDAPAQLRGGLVRKLSRQFASCHRIHSGKPAPPRKITGNRPLLKTLRASLHETIQGIHRTIANQLLHSTTNGHGQKSGRQHQPTFQTGGNVSRLRKCAAFLSSVQAAFQNQPTPLPKTITRTPVDGLI